ncbi:uncharacterized protein LOC122072809 [Macadamia integrifolia]|uniref:uncharacterized protein LOC122072809 n=1 Tax=Macadamia integrifolia TaxID=60698 RepID=UPI001C4E463C|nr:uncharacterized protein LOC122072809 [Macadamia integrifolia]
MENQRPHKATLFLSLFLILLSSSFVFLAHALSPTGTIDRTTKQQILASLPPKVVPSGSSQLFLTSPSGKYAAFLLRRPTMLGAGGFGNDFCYIQVQEAGQSMWESDCAPVSSENTCSLVFDDSGLEIFDGSNSMWNTDADVDNFLETLELVDSGDMRLRDKDGRLAWRASDNPQANQNCGSMGSPGLAPETPPFAKPVQNNAPFGQPGPIQEQQLPAPVGMGPVSLGPVGLGVGGVGAPLTQPPQGQVGFEEPPQPQPQPQSDQPQFQTQPQLGLNQPPSSTAFNYQPLSSVNQPQPFGGGSNYQRQPLVDNNPFDSGTSGNSPFKYGGIALVSIVTLMAYYGFFL